MRLFEEIYEKEKIKELKNYYRKLGFSTKVEGKFESGAIVNVSDKGEFDFFDKKSSGISFGIIQLEDGDIIINFWSIRLVGDKQGKGLAAKLVDGFVNILQPVEITAVDLAKEGFCQYLEKRYPHIDIVIED